MKCGTCPVTTVDLKLTVTKPSMKKVSVLPKADFLAITWTEAETWGLATVFGAGKYTFETTTQNNFTPLLIDGLQPPDDEMYHAQFFKATVNGRSVVCLKSNFHPKVQTSSTAMFFDKILGSASNPNYNYLITSGTSGGIWASLDVGDVVVTNSARYGMTLPQEKQQLIFTGAINVGGGNPPAGYSNWYDYVTNEIMKNDACVNSTLMTPGGRKTSSPKPAIYYMPSGVSLTDVVTNSKISESECSKISTYRTLGATLDENDAYVAETCKSIGFQNWISIRNISDLPCSPNKDQYTTYDLCSSINGAYAVWAFVMSH